MKNTALIALVAAASLLGACTSLPPKQQATAGSPEVANRWNGGVWNSVLGYHGPSNTMDPSKTGN